VHPLKINILIIINLRCKNNIIFLITQVFFFKDEDERLRKVEKYKAGKINWEKEGFVKKNDTVFRPKTINLTDWFFIFLIYENSHFVLE
jgi:hypothetical protein